MFLVLGMAVAFGFIGANLRSSGEALTGAQVGYYKYSFARNMSRLAVNRHLRYIDRGVTPPSSATFEGGSYTVSTTSLIDTLTIVSTGMYAESTYTMRVKLLFTPKPFPGSESAIGMISNNSEFNISGKASVDGHNWDATGTTLVGSGDLPGITVSNSGDSSQIVNDGSVAPYISGAIKVGVNEDALSPAAFIPEYEQSAHYTFNSPGNIAGSWVFGSVASPVIVVCNVGTADTNFSIRFTGNVVGWGILAINGNVKFSGSFTWYGLVMAYGEENVISFEALGNPQIVGGVIVAGEAVHLTLKGTGSGGKVKYSSEALDNARRIGRLLYYSVVEWYE